MSAQSEQLGTTKQLRAKASEPSLTFGGTQTSTATLQITGKASESPTGSYPMTQLYHSLAYAQRTWHHTTDILVHNVHSCYTQKPGDENNQHVDNANCKTRRLIKQREGGVSEDDVQLANKHEKRSTSLAIGETWI